MLKICLLLLWSMVHNFPWLTTVFSPWWKVRYWDIRVCTFQNIYCNFIWYSICTVLFPLYCRNKLHKPKWPPQWDGIEWDRPSVWRLGKLFLWSRLGVPGRTDFHWDSVQCFRALVCLQTNLPKWVLSHHYNNTMSPCHRIKQKFKVVLYIKAWKMDHFTSSALPLQP